MLSNVFLQSVLFEKIRNTNLKSMFNYDVILVPTNIKINCLKTFANILLNHMISYYNMSITRDRFRPYWISSGGCKKYTIINMLTLNHKRFALACKILMRHKAVQYNNTYIKGVLFKETHTWYGQKVTSVSLKRDA